MKLLYYWSKILLKFRGKSIRGSKLQKTTKINSGSNIVNSTIGKYTYCGYDCWIIETQIGNFCSISNNVRIGGPNHPIDWVSMSPVFYVGRNKFNKHFYEHEYNPYKCTIIGNDVWIGENTLIKAGVRIGNGTVIGMGSVVTKSIGDYEIWAGNPAKFIKKRFGDDTIEELNKIEWWNLPDEKISEIACYFNSPSKLINSLR